MDEFSYHEAIDRSFIVSEMLEDILLNHPVISKHKKLRKRVEKAADLIGEVYQKVSEISDKKFGDDLTFLQNGEDDA